jgi:hypothetical protein
MKKINTMIAFLAVMPMAVFASSVNAQPDEVTFITIDGLSLPTVTKDGQTCVNYISDRSIQKYEVSSDSGVVRELTITTSQYCDESIIRNGVYQPKSLESLKYNTTSGIHFIEVSMW